MRSREQIAQVAARELRDGQYVNLGVGMPTLVSNFIPDDIEVMLQAENGMLGIGPYPACGDEDPDFINAGKETVTMVAGASLFDSATSFAMIRGGHIDLAILGAMQVAQNGDLANWMIPGKRVKGMGGAMDLASGARRVVIMMEHVSKSGEPKLVEQLSMPATGVACVDRVVTDLCTLDIRGGRFVVSELADGVTFERVQAVTSAPLEAG